jgi:glutathione S-transferase
MYKVIGTVTTRALRVVWMMEELGLPYDHIAATPRSDAALAVTPTGKVPVLIADGTAIADSTAIIQFLADKHGAFTHPAGTLARAQQDSLTQFLLDELDATLWMAARHSFVLPAELRQPDIKQSLIWEFERSQRSLVARMGDGPYLMGHDLTVPDIILTHCLVWAKSAKFPIIEDRLVNYSKHVRARPAFQRAIAK